MELQELEELLRIHFVKVRLIKSEGKYEIIDNFNQVSFTATIPEDDKRYLNVQNLEPTTLFHIVQSTDEEFIVKSSYGQNIGYVRIQRHNESDELIGLEILNAEKEIRFKLTKSPLIQRTHEFQVTSIEAGAEVGRINVARSKAILSMQPEIQTIHKARIISTSIILLGIYNECWPRKSNLNNDSES